MSQPSKRRKTGATTSQTVVAGASAQQPSGASSNDINKSSTNNLGAGNSKAADGAPAAQIIKPSGKTEKGKQPNQYTKAKLAAQQKKGAAPITQASKPAAKDSAKESKGAKGGQ